jgi:hypothetical protein
MEQGCPNVLWERAMTVIVCWFGTARGKITVSDVSVVSFLLYLYRTYFTMEAVEVLGDFRI